ncbi:hypothetical protein AX16_010675 [Volvariella volvacea WC 439]|nr:hypothetical protein AX16_010675 [Volvariella volvacea WC 439]
MHNPNTHTRSSIDLGHSRNRNPNELATASTHLPRPPPPRLQHSPSLPNIWFPPHSGPIPNKCFTGNSSPPRRPLTPPALGATENSTQNSVQQEMPPETKKMSGDGSNKPVPAAPPRGGSPAPTDPSRIQTMHKRPQPDRVESHPLLTPPLTPSSSIRTTASHDSSASGATRQSDSTADTCAVDYADALDSVCSRFLLLGNVSRTIDPDELQAAIAESLMSTRPGESHELLTVPNWRNSPSHTIRDLIKGLYLRSQQTHGIVILAFYDIRQAPIAKLKLQDTTSTALAKCVANDAQWLSCRFVSSNELVEMRSTPPFLSSMDGSFFIRAQGRSNTGEATGVRINEESQADLPSNSHSSPSPTTQSANDKHPEIKTNMLQRLLDSFGSVRSFSPVDANNKDEKDGAEIFKVEYYDVREADSAYIALEGQALFGMTLTVYGRDVNRKGGGECNSRRSSYKSDNPQATAASIEAPTIGRPGQYSQIRERLAAGDQATRMKTSAKHVAPALVNSASPSAPSPTYFYTSASSTPDGALPHRKASHLPTQEPATKPLNNGQAIQCVEAQGPGHVDGAPHWTPMPMHPGEVVPYPYALHDYYYYASRPPMFNPNFDATYYTGCSSPPLPGVYYPPSVAQPGAGHPGQTTVIYDHEGRPYSTLNNWLPEQSVTTPHPTRNGTVPLMADYWTPEFQPYPPHVHGAPPYHQYPQACATPIDQASSTDASTPHNDHTRINFTRSNASPTISTVPTNSTRDHLIHERNQLNIGRIEDGQDTRTTVMIKNIPNKMSDKDLITFINKVTPRRIDFIYLRMDFQNGCNVGYAFVNFIQVQDLLTFAKAKLGEKWNMFSSEKVLQMSYANYQGKEALVEKFKNSCIMDEREAWRPKIFYSEPGPDQGLPQPFPAPTHLRRKERSSHNRGALYVPGVGNGPTSHGLLTHRRGGPHADQHQNDRHSRMTTSRYKENNISSASANKNPTALYHGP